mmetsp:Transcript_87005/g.246654  ORF Transcript_87005/g.246654 Transcript_87005/m.246654 type:complete len:176 (-) Transcript_87005:97-624(-)
MRSAPERAPLLAAILSGWLPLASSAACPDSFRFAAWLRAYEGACDLFNGTLEAGAPGSCPWVTCSCLEVSLMVPVDTGHIQSCLGDSAVRSQFSDARWRLVSALFDEGGSCSTRIQQLGGDCGECDRYAHERPHCSTERLGPMRIFIPSRGGHAAPTWGLALLLGAVATPCQRPI